MDGSSSSSNSSVSYDSDTPLLQWGSVAAGSDPESSRPKVQARVPPGKRRPLPPATGGGARAASGSGAQLGASPADAHPGLVVHSAGGRAPTVYRSLLPSRAVRRADSAPAAGPAGGADWVALFTFARGPLIALAVAAGVWWRSARRRSREAKRWAKVDARLDSEGEGEGGAGRGHSDAVDADEDVRALLRQLRALPGGGK